MRPAKFNDFLRLANFFYYILGIKPYDEPGRSDYKRTLLDNFFFYTGFINMNFVLVIEILYIVDSMLRKVHFLEATLSMSYIGFLLAGEFKMLSVRRKKQELTDLMCELYEIFPKNVKDQKTYQMERYLNQCKIVTKGFSLLYTVLIWVYNFFAISEWLIYERWLKTRVVGKNIPYFAYLPYNWQDHWSYYLIYISEDFAAFSCGSGHVASDLLLCAVATQLIMHYDHVSRSIMNYNLKANKETNNPKKRQKHHENDLKFLSGMISYHNKVLSLSDLVNDIFGVPLLFNFMIACALLCFVGFQITAGQATTDMQIKLMVFLISVGAQIYMISHYGQLLIDVSTNVAYAVYHHDWSNADIRYKKMLVLITQRAQIPSYLQATSFVSISKNTMTELMQISYKFFALLRTMYSD